MILSLNNYRNLYYLLINLILISTLTSCTNVIDFQDNLIFKQQQSVAAKQGLEYLRLANNYSSIREKNKFLLYAIESFIQANEIEEAKLALTKIDKNSLNDPQYVVWKILLAQINLIANNLPEAKSLVASVNGYQNLDSEIYQKLYQTKIKIFQQSGEPLEAIQAQINLEKFLTNNQEIIANHKSIWEQLQQLSPNFLLAVNPDNFNYTMQGWLKIASIIRKYDNEPQELTVEVAQWQQHFPNHPAHQILGLNHYKNYQKSWNEPSDISDNWKQPNKIALLLPLSGSYSASGLAVKNGFLAAAFNKKSASKPKIIVFDTNQQSLVEIHKQLQSQAVDLIVGPLLKDEVEKFTNLKLIAPTIALNNLSRSHTKLLYQFALPPETEGHAIISRARNNKYRNALLIIENHKSNQRIANTIVSNWKLLGNNIIERIDFTRSADLHELLKNALGINSSWQRANDLSKLGIKFNFDPRRRQDIDCIFLITNATHARQIKPLLNFYYASKIPVYATSSVYTGIHNPSLDRDLDGIEFCDIPWMIDPTIASGDTYQSIKNLWKENFNKNPRLYALGIDAYKLANQMQLLHYVPEIGISGVTGVLTINPDNIIVRKLMWGTFQNGIPIIIHQKN